MEKKKIAIIAIVLLLVVGIALGLVYQFVLKDGEAKKAILFEDIYDGEATEEILEKELEVKISLFGVFFNMRQGKDEPKLRVTLTNKLETAKSFTLEVGAFDKETGELIKVSTLEVESLEPGVAERFDMFTDVDITDKEIFFKAEYKIIKVVSK